MSPTWSTTDGAVKLYLGDCLSLLQTLDAGSIDCVVTDPPYGIAYESNSCNRPDRAGCVPLPGIVGDSDASIRDAILEHFHDKPAIVFGSWKIPRPERTKAVLIWEKGNHIGMGDLSIPWKPNTEEIYVIGSIGFSGHRGSSVLRFNAPVSWNSVSFGRDHAHQKPVELMRELVGKCDGKTICDPTMGSGTTGVAAVRLGRRFVGCEIDENHFATSVNRIKAELSRCPLWEEPPKIQRSMLESEYENR